MTKGIEQILQIWEGLEAKTTDDFDILYLIAEAYWRSGQAIQGLKVFEEAKAHLSKVGPKMIQLRLKANLLVRLKDATKLLEAEQLFRSAIQIERSCRAKWSELRSTTALARLLRDTNRRDEARAMLAEIYNWFTEGLDLPDLKGAKALLEELSNTATSLTLRMLNASTR
jgi:hypothetical protein